MPELPEVETVRRGLADRLVDFYIDNVEVCRESSIASPGGSQKFIEMLKGLRVGSWSRRGKYLIAHLHKNIDPNQSQEEGGVPGGKWGVHLRMTGQFQWHSSPSKPCSHTRVRIWNQKGEELRFVDMRSFGQMWFVPPEQSAETIIKGLKKLGPEPFSTEFNLAYLKKRLRGSMRPIKSALLDQSLLAGVGNIYADESLFSAGILPKTPSGQLKTAELKLLHESLLEVLRISIGKGGTTFSDFRDLEGINGKYGGQAWVYGREGKSCRICGTPIQRERLSGRGTHWCPKCQH